MPRAAPHPKRRQFERVRDALSSSSDEEEVMVHDPHVVAAVEEDEEVSGSVPSTLTAPTVEK